MFGPVPRGRAEDDGVGVGQHIGVGHGHVCERLLRLDRPHLLQNLVVQRLGDLGEQDFGAGDLPRPGGLGLGELIDVRVEAVEDDLNLDRHGMSLLVINSCW